MIPSIRKRNGTEEYFLISLFVTGECRADGHEKLIDSLSQVKEALSLRQVGTELEETETEEWEEDLGGVHVLFHVKLHSHTTVCYPKIISLLVICILRCILNNFAFLLMISMGLLWCSWLCLIAREGQPKVARKNQLLSFYCVFFWDIRILTIELCILT